MDLPAMEIIVVLGLAGVWIWVLGRPVLASLFDRSRRDPVGQFNREMSGLSAVPNVRSLNSAGSHTMVHRQNANRRAMSRSRSRKRRLQISLGLVMAAVVSLVLAVAFGGAFVMQHILIDVCLAAYVALAVRDASAGSRRSSQAPRVVAESIPNPVYPQAVNAR